MPIWILTSMASTVTNEKKFDVSPSSGPWSSLHETINRLEEEQDEKGRRAAFSFASNSHDAEDVARLTKRNPQCEPMAERISTILTATPKCYKNSGKAKRTRWTNAKDECPIRRENWNESELLSDHKESQCLIWGYLEPTVASSKIRSN